MSIETSESKTLHCLNDNVEVMVEEKRGEVYIRIDNTEDKKIWFLRDYGYGKDKVYVPLKELINAYEERREKEYPARKGK